MPFQPHRKALSASEQKIYDDISKCLISRAESVSVCEKDFALIGRIFELVKLDNPYLYYVESVQVETYSNSSITTVIPVYNAYKDDLTARQQIEYIGQKVVSRTQKTDVWNTLLYLHDRICKCVTYENTGDDAHTIFGVLLNNRAVCDGISKTFKFFCDLQGIPCCVVTGRAKQSYDAVGFEAHAWNKVFFKGSWFNVDVTYDLTISDKDHIRHDYFLVNDRSISGSHKEDFADFSATKSDEDYYSVNNLVMNTQKDLEQYIKVNYKKGVRFFEIKLPAAQNVDAVKKKIFNVVIQALSFENVTRKIEVSSNKNMLIFGIRIL